MKRIVALLLGVVMLSALLFSVVVASGCGGETETPAQIIDKAIAKSGDTKSLHADYKMNIDVKGDASALGSEFEGLLPLSLGISGGADIDNNGDQPKAKGTIKFDGLDKIFQSLAASEGTLDPETMVGVNMIGSLLADMEFVLLDEKVYIKMGGSWYETDASSASDVADLGGAAASAGDVDSDCMQNALKDTSKFGANVIFSDIQDAGTEKINGADAKHYKANLNLDSTLTALANALRDCGDAEAAGSLEAGKSELNGMFKTKTIELWIDNDNNIVQVKVDVELDPAALTSAAEGLSGADLSGTSTGSSTDSAPEGLDSISFSMTLTMSNFNQSMNITKPEGNILKLEDLLGGSSGLGGILGGSTGTSGLEGLDGTSTGTSTSSSTRTATTSSY